MFLDAIVRRFPALKVLSEATQALRMTGHLSLATAQVEAARQEATRAGRMFYLGNNAAVTGQAPSASLPTTAAQWALCNNDPNRSYIFDEVGLFLSSSGPPAVGGFLLATIFTLPMTTTLVAGTAVQNSSNGGLVSKMGTAKNVTVTTPAAPVWYPMSFNMSSQTVTAFPASAGGFEHRNLQGSLILPPNSALGLCAIVGAGTTPLYSPFARWTEAELDLE